MTTVSSWSYAPISYHIGTGLAILAASVGDKVKFIAWRGEWVPNLYVLLLGPSGGGKSTALRIGRQVYEKANGNKRVLPKDITMSGLFRVFDPAQENGSSSHLWAHSELAQFLATLYSEYNRGLRESLTDVYDYEELSSFTMKDGVRRVHPALTILAASNPEWLTAYVRENDVMGGFLPRFSFFPATEEGDEPEDWDKDSSNDYSSLADSLHYFTDLQGFVNFSDVRDVMSMWMKAHKEHAREMVKSDTRLSPFMQRYGHMFLKITVLLNISMHASLRIEPDAVEAAMNLTRWIRTNFESMVLDKFAFDRNSKGVLVIKNALANGPMSKTALQKAVRGQLTSNKDFLFSIENAVELNDIEEVDIGKNGKPRWVYRLVQ